MSPNTERTGQGTQPISQSRPKRLVSDIRLTNGADVYGTLRMRTVRARQENVSNRCGVCNSIEANQLATCSRSFQNPPFGSQGSLIPVQSAQP